MADTTRITELLEQVLPHWFDKQGHDKGISNKAASRDIGVSDVTIGKWRQGERIGTGRGGMSALDSWLERERSARVEHGDMDWVAACDELRGLLNQDAEAQGGDASNRGARLAAQERRPTEGPLGRLYNLAKTPIGKRRVYAGTFEKLDRKLFGLGAPPDPRLPPHIRRRSDAAVTEAIRDARDAVGADRMVVVTTDLPGTASRDVSTSAGLTHSALHAICAAAGDAEILAVEHASDPQVLADFVALYRAAADHHRWDDHPRVVFIDDVDRALRALNLPRLIDQLTGSPVDPGTHKPVVVMTCAAASLRDVPRLGITGPTRELLAAHTVPPIPVRFDPVDEADLEFAEAEPLLPWLVQRLTANERIRAEVERARNDENRVRWSLLQALKLAGDAGRLTSDETMAVAEDRYVAMTGATWTDRMETGVHHTLMSMRAPDGLDGAPALVDGVAGVPPNRIDERPGVPAGYRLSSYSRPLVTVPAAAAEALPPRAAREHLAMLLASGQQATAIALLLPDLEVDEPWVTASGSSAGELAEKGMELLAGDTPLTVTQLDVLSALVAAASRTVHGHDEGISLLTAAADQGAARAWSVVAALLQWPQLTDDEATPAQRAAALRLWDYDGREADWQIPDLAGAHRALQKGIERGADDLWRLVGDLHVRGNKRWGHGRPLPTEAVDAYRRAADRGDVISAIRVAYAPVLRCRTPIGESFYDEGDPKERVFLPRPTDQPAIEAVAAAVETLTAIAAEPDDTGDVPPWLPHALIALMRHSAGDRDLAAAAVADALAAGLPSRQRSASAAVHDAATRLPDDMPEPAWLLRQVVDVDEHPDLVDEVADLLSGPRAAWARVQAAKARQDIAAWRHHLRVAAQLGNRAAAKQYLVDAERRLHLEVGDAAKAAVRDPNHPLVAKAAEAADLLVEAMDGSWSWGRGLKRVGGRIRAARQRAANGRPEPDYVVRALEEWAKRAVAVTGAPAILKVALFDAYGYLGEPHFDVLEALAVVRPTLAYAATLRIVEHAHRMRHVYAFESNTEQEWQDTARLQQVYAGPPPQEELPEPSKRLDGLREALHEMGDAEQVLTELAEVTAALFADDPPYPPVPPWVRPSAADEPKKGRGRTLTDAEVEKVLKSLDSAEDDGDDEADDG